MQAAGAGVDELLHLGVVDWHEVLGQVAVALVVGVGLVVVDAEAEVDRAGADADLERPGRVAARDAVQLGQPDRAALDRAVGQDVEPGALLVPDHARDRVVERLGVRLALEGAVDVPAVQLVGEPARARVGADHRGRQRHVDDLAHAPSSQSAAPWSTSATPRNGLPLPPLILSGRPTNQKLRAGIRSTLARFSMFRISRSRQTMWAGCTFTSATSIQASIDGASAPIEMAPRSFNRSVAPRSRPG